MHEVDQKLIGFITSSVNEKVKKSYSTKQIKQIIENIVETRVKAYFVEMAHENLNNMLKNQIKNEIMKLISNKTIIKHINKKCKEYILSDDFNHCIRTMFQDYDEEYF
jgi:hypothetical protein